MHCTQFFQRVSDRSVALVASCSSARSRLLDPSPSAKDLGLLESDEDTLPEAGVMSLLLGIYREHMRNSGKEDKDKTNNLVSATS